jgi:hypothetical protein
MVSLATEAQSPMWVEDHITELKAAIQKDLAMSLAEPRASVVLESVRMPSNGPASIGALHVKFHSTAAADAGGSSGCDKAKEVLHRGDLRFGATALLIGHTKGPVIPGTVKELVKMENQKVEASAPPKGLGMSGYWPKTN